MSNTRKLIYVTHAKSTHDHKSFKNNESKLLLLRLITYSSSILHDILRRQIKRQTGV